MEKRDETVKENMGRASMGEIQAVGGKVEIANTSMLKRNERVELRRGSAVQLTKGDRSNTSNRRNIRTGGFTML